MYGPGSPEPHGKWGEGVGAWGQCYLEKEGGKRAEESIKLLYFSTFSNILLLWFIKNKPVKCSISVH